MDEERDDEKEDEDEEDEMTECTFLLNLWLSTFNRI